MCHSLGAVLLFRLPESDETKLTVKHRGSLMLWGCRVSWIWTRQNEIGRLWRDSGENMLLCLELCLNCRSCLLQQDNNSKHTSKSTENERDEINWLFWSGLLQVLILIQFIHGKSCNLQFHRYPLKLRELEQFGQEELATPVKRHLEL